MAFFGHFVVGLSIILPFYFFNKEKFNHKVAAIFVISNWIGPDSAQAYFFLKWDFQSFEWDFHYLLPFAIWGTLLALFFSYLSRFSITKTNHFLKIRDDLERTLNWKNAYFLALSGGIIHTITDTLTRSNLKIKFFETFFELTLFDIQSWGTDIGIQSKEIQLISYLVLIVFTFLLLFIFEQDVKSILIYFGSLIAIILIGGLAIGDGFLGGEYDMGTVFFSLIFIFLPLFLLLYVFNDVHKKTSELSSIDQENLQNNSNSRFYAVISIVLFIMLLVLLLGIFSFLQLEFIVNSLNFSTNVFTILGISLMIIGSIGLVGGICLLFRLELARLTIMILFSLLLLFVFPLAIVFYLAQTNVKEIFKKGEK